MGTTISPYLFFWQAGQEVEDTKEGAGARPLTRAPEQAPSEFTRIRIDTYIGMAISNLVAFFIVITTAATLNANGVTDIQTSAQAAEALRAVAGPLTFAVFAAGIIGTGMGRCRRWRDRRLMRWARCSPGMSAWRACRGAPRLSTRRSQWAWRWVWR
jgi:Mn2+/Fe2+ NRAMP family transporter